MNIADWLRALGLERYEAAFEENSVMPLFSFRPGRIECGDPEQSGDCVSDDGALRRVHCALRG